MSKTIDERVVEMRFNSSQFVENVQTSLTMLEKLKAGLKLENASKGLETVDEAARKINMESLGSAVDTVKLKFSAMEIVAITALTNITNSAINTGKRMIAALTIDPISTGLQEYETQINAVQTILANTSHNGTTLQEVNSALDELNLYADKTIYNFTEMTRNIGTFTAAGIDLRTSVDSIKGIANLAAVSGSTSQQASTAMYQLSQALAAGKVQLMDWNSVVNAGMGGKVFQDALTRTSELLGTGAEAAIKSYGSFRESLTKGEWLTTEVLTETLKQFAGAYSEADLIAQGFTETQAKEIAKMAVTAEDAATKVKTFTQLWDTLKESAQSGWTESWEIIIGDFEEAKATLTEISDTVGEMIGKMSDARNTVLRGGLSTGWKQLLDQGISDEAGYIEEIKNVARESSKVFDLMVNYTEEAGGTFADALKKGLSTGVISSNDLAEAVHNLSEKMANMSQEERKSAGYTSEMIEQIQELDKGLKDGSVSMDEFVEKIMKPSGRENVIQALWNAAKGLGNALEPVKEAFNEVFPPKTAKELSEHLYSFTEGLRAVSERMVLSEEMFNNLKSTFKGLFSVLDIGKQAFTALITAAKPLTALIGPLVTDILRLTASVGDSVSAFDAYLKSSGIFQNTAQALSNILETLVARFLAFKNTIKEKIEAAWLELVNAVLERVADRMAMVSESAENTKSIVVTAFEAIGSALANCQFLKVLNTMWSLISSIGGGMATAIGNLITTIGNADFSGILDILNGISLGGIAVALTKFVSKVKGSSGILDIVKDNLIDVAKGAFGGALDAIDKVSGVLDGVRSSLEAYQQNLKAEVLSKIAIAMAILAASIVAISFIDSDKLNAALGAMAVLFTELMGSMAAFGKIGGKTKSLAKSMSVMLGISVSILILASALKKIAELDVDQLIIGLTGVGGLAAVMIKLAETMSKEGAVVIKGSSQMILLAIAIKVLASACKDLSELSFTEMAKGLIGVKVLMSSVSKFLNKTELNNKMISTSVGVVILAAALKVMASACKDFGEIDAGSLLKGMLAITILMGELIAFTKETEKATNMVSVGVGIIAVGAAMKIFASAIRDLGSMSLEDLAKGLSAMSLALVAVTLALRKMPKNMAEIGVGLDLVSIALLAIAESLSIMGSMSVEAVAKSLITLGGSLAILAVALKKMTGSIAGSQALLLASVALAAIVPTLLILGGMSLGSIVKGLIALAGAFTVIGVAAKVLTPLLPTISALAKSLTLIGLSVLAVGAGLTLAGTGLMALAAGFAALAGAGAAGAAAFVASLTIIVTGIAGLIPVIMAKVGEAIVEFCKVIANGAPAIGEAVKAVVLTLVDVFVECLPAFIEGIILTINGILDALVEYAPTMIDSLFQLLIMVLEGLDKYLPELIQVAINLIADFFSGIVDALAGIDTTTLIETIAGVGLLTGLMTALGAVSSLIPKAMVAVVEMGILIAELAVVLAAIGAFAQIPGLNWLINEGGNLLQSIGTAIGKFIGGIVGGFASGVSSQFPQIASDLSSFMTNAQPFLDGAAGIDSTVLDGVKNLVAAILMLTGVSLVDRITSWITGGSSLSDFAAELVPFGTSMKEFSDEVEGISGEAVQNAAIAAQALAELADNLPDSGGLISWFTGDNDISSFGESLVSFGTSLADFSDAVSGIDTAALSAVTIEVRGLVDLAKGMSDIDSSGMSTFAQNLTNLGNAGVDGFINAFAGANSRVIAAANTMITTFITAVAMQKVMLLTTFTVMASEIMLTFTSQYAQFTLIGTTVMMNFITGVTSTEVWVRTTFTTMVTICVAAMKESYTDFYNTGIYLVEGFAAGIDEYTWYAEAKAKAMAKAADEAARRELGIASPSKVAYEIGGYFGQGFVNALSDYESTSYNAGTSLAASAKSGLQTAVSKISDFIENSIDSQPTIRPILDLSEVQSQAGQLSAMFSRNQAMSISSGIQQAAVAGIQNGSSGSAGNSVTINAQFSGYAEMDAKKLIRLVNRELGRVT